MKILAKAGRDDIATVYIAEFDNNKRIEFVESTQPPISREKKWVLIISSLYGCPVNCQFCDAGGSYYGKLSKDELFAQIDFLVKTRFPDGNINCEKFKIQFARMGDPAFNLNVIDLLEELPKIYNIPGLLPSVSTIAPKNTDVFFDRLKQVKKTLYKDNFQLQFSIHTTDKKTRDWLIPVDKWSFEKISEYGEDFFDQGDRKITLNFALSSNLAVNPDVLLKHFDVDKYLIKITPVNPTVKAVLNNLEAKITNDSYALQVANDLKNQGYEVIVSVGELEENNIGSNCGQYLTSYLNHAKPVENSYTYELEKIGSN
ncbi:MAG: hypothetical protein MZV70_69860 [Desulfobacterales bacterium]|nr:hypothetical protein [Desulfobacterales bacterium]